LAERPAVAAAMASVVDLGLYQRSKAEREYAEAQMAMDELAKRRRQLLDARDVEETFVAVGVIRRAALGAVSKALAPSLIGLTDLAEIERRLDAAMDEVGQKISDDSRRKYGEAADGRTVAAG
jgi:hypothetical protein